MLTRMTFMVPAILTACFGTICLNAARGQAANDCLAKPNAASPQGSHWYYRVDRATHQHCWYLAAQGGTAVQPVRRQAAAKPRPTPPTVEIPEDAPARITNEERVPEIPNRTAEPAQTSLPTTLSQRWSGFPTSAISFDPAPTSMSSYAQEQPAAAAEDEMPLVWPILTPAELAEGMTQGMEAPRPPPSMWKFAAAFVAALGLATILVHALLRLTSTRKVCRAATPARANADFGQTIARGAARPTPNRPAELDASVPQLLRELRRRQQEYQKQDFQRAAAALG